MEKFMSATKNVSNTHTYHGNSEINFFTDNNEGLSVTIDTNHLHIRSVQATETEYDRYALLYGDKDVMAKLGTGQTKTREEIQTRINDSWVKHWRENDPYSGLAIFKNDSDDFIGHVVLGHGDAPGESEVSYLFHRAHWRKGYGSEAVTAMVKEYAPATVTEGYTLDGKALKKIVATARPDNPASCRILEKVGMHFTHTAEKYGAFRHHYSMDLSELEKKTIAKAASSRQCIIL
jgi:RimJ/RimL family protein N-acetyltransferase